MNNERRTGFCVECGHETEYALKKQMISKTIKGREYNFYITTAICTECGEEMNFPGLIDKNIKEIDEQYRKMEGIVSVEDIENFLNIYKIGKAPASYALGFGEITIARYLAGQVPSKEYSDIIKAALSSPKYMKKLLTALSATARYLHFLAQTIRKVKNMFPKSSAKRLCEQIQKVITGAIRAVVQIMKILQLVTC